MHQATGVEQVNTSAAIGIRTQDVLQLQSGLAKQLLGALLLQSGQTSQQGLGRCAGEQCAILTQQLRVILEVIEQRLEILHVEQQQALSVCHLEGGIQRGLLAIGQCQQVAQQQRPHFTERGAQGMPTLAGDVPQRDRVCLRMMIQPGHAGDALGHLALRITDGAQATQVPLHVGGKNRHASIAEQLGQMLQGHGLASPRGARNQSMAIGQAQCLGDGLSLRVSPENECISCRHLAFLLSKP